VAARQQYTLAQVQAKVYDRLQQSPFWSAAEVTAFINESLRLWSILTGYWKKRVTLTTLPTLPYYSLASYLAFGMRVEFNGTPLAQSSVTNWDKGYPEWEGNPSSPQEWAPIGLSLIAIRPADAVGNNSLVLDGVANAPILAKAGDFIDIGSEELTALLGYCQYLAAFKEGGQEFESAIPLYQAFLKAAAVKNEKLNASAIFRRAMGLDPDLAGQHPRRAKSQLQPIGAR
jgi:hypothetical protein